MRVSIRGIESRSIVVAALLWAGLVGCATQPEALPIPKPRAILLAPASVDQRLAQPLRSGAPIIQQVIGQVLWEQDVQVNAPPLPEFYELWRGALQNATGGDDSLGDPRTLRYDVAVRALLDGLRARGKGFDALLVPYLTIRPGTVTGQSVMWDGVTRRLPFLYKHRDVNFLVVRRGIEAPCTSLGVIAYGPHGERLFERIGGLEVAKRMQITDDGRRRSWSSREDLFQDARALRSGVQVALLPLLRN